MLKLTYSSVEIQTNPGEGPRIGVWRGAER